MIANQDDATPRHRHWNEKIERICSCGFVNDNRVEFNSF